MKTQGTVNQPTTDYKTEFISVYRENSKDILKILRDQAIGYRLFGEDQSNRMLFQITYDESQTNNVSVIRKGIRELERGNHLTDLIITGITRLLA